MASSTPPQPKTIVTMYDIAVACGVNQSTVSRALFNPRKVSPKTRAKVEKAARELGYAYKRQDPGPTPRRRKLVGVIFTFRLYWYLADTLSFISKLADEMDYEVMFELINSGEEKEVDAFRRLQQYRASAFICFDASPELESLLYTAQRQGIPSFILWQTPQNRKLNFAALDMVKAARLATEELIRHGHERISILLPRSADFRTTVSNRLNGYRKALTDAGLHPNLAWECYLGGEQARTWEPLSSQVQKALRELLQVPVPPTGLVVPNSHIAILALASIRDAGLQVPADMSIVCMRNDEIAAALDPPLTCLSADADEQSRLLSDFLESLFTNKPLHGLHHDLTMQVIQRQSCAPPTQKRST